MAKFETHILQTVSTRSMCRAWVLATKKFQNDIRKIDCVASIVFTKLVASLALSVLPCFCFSTSWQKQFRRDKIIESDCHKTVGHWYKVELCVFLLLHSLWALEAIVLACSSSNYCCAHFSVRSLCTVLCVCVENVNRHTTNSLKGGGASS